MRLRFSTLAGAAAALALASGGSLAATFSASVNATSGTINISGPTRDDNRTDNSPVSLNTSSFQSEALPSGGDSGGSGWGSSSSSASAVVGALHLQASSAANIASTNGGAIVGLGGSSASGYFSDSFIINAGSCSVASACGAGAVGTVTFFIGITGPVGGTGNYATTTPEGGNGGWSGSAEWNLGGSVSAGAVPPSTSPSYVDWLRGQQFSADQRGPLPPVITGSGAGSESYTISFVFGQAISFSMLGQVYSSAGASYDFYASQNKMGSSSASSSWSADLSHTMAWGGIAELRDADGNLLSNYAALSADTGFDYRNAYSASAVPEPASLWLWGAGLVGLGGLIRRRLKASA